MRPIDSSNPIDATGAAVAPDLPQVPGAPVPNAPISEQPADTSDPASVAARRMEQDLEAAYFRGQLDQAQHGPAGGVLYDNPSHDPGAGAVETKHASAVAPSSFVGQRLGTNQSGAEVKVKREVGSPQGYDDKLQAIAVARMGGAEPAVVVQDKGNPPKWHALETTAPADAAVGGVYPLPSSKGISDLAKEVKSLKQQLGDINQKIQDITAAGGTVPKELQQKRDDLGDQITRDYHKLASQLFGVPESEIQFNRSPDDDKPGKINIDAGGDGVGTEHMDTFALGSTPAFSIRLDQLENPDQAMGVLFHEMTHVEDNKMAQGWIGQYNKEKAHFPDTPEGLQKLQDWMKSPTGRNDFVKWVHSQPANKLSKADAELVLNLTDPTLSPQLRNSTTQARAYVHAAIAALQAGDPEVAKRQLKSYAAAIKDKKTANPGTNSDVQIALTNELRNLSPEMRRQFAAAVADAQSENSDAWISQVKLSK